VGEWWVAIILLHHEHLSVPAPSDAKQAPRSHGGKEDEWWCIHEVAQPTSG
jgi:hypothetical protein